MLLLDAIIAPTMRCTIAVASCKLQFIKVPLTFSHHQVIFMPHVDLLDYFNTLQINCTPNYRFSVRTHSHSHTHIYIYRCHNHWLITTNLHVLLLLLHCKVIVHSTSCRYSVTEGTDILELWLNLVYVLPICGVRFVYCLTLSQLPL